MVPSTAPNMPSATASSLCRHPADAGCGPNVDSAMSAATAVMIARFVMIPIVCLDPFSRSHRRVIAQCTPGTWRACVEHGLYFCNVDQQPFRNDGYTNIHKLIRQRYRIPVLEAASPGLSQYSRALRFSPAMPVRG